MELRPVCVPRHSGLFLGGKQQHLGRLEEGRKRKGEEGEGEVACGRLQNKCVLPFSAAQKQLFNEGRKKENIIPLLITNVRVCYLLCKHLLGDVVLLLHFGSDREGGN